MEVFKTCTNDMFSLKLSVLQIFSVLSQISTFCIRVAPVTDSADIQMSAPGGHTVCRSQLNWYSLLGCFTEKFCMCVQERNSGPLLQSCDVNALLLTALNIISLLLVQKKSVQDKTAQTLSPPELSHHIKCNLDEMLQVNLMNANIIHLCEMTFLIQVIQKYGMCLNNSATVLVENK